MDLPQPLIKSLTGVAGFNEAAFIAVHQQGAHVTAVRINHQKVISGIDHKIFDENIYASVPWSSVGYYLKERPSFTLDPLFHAGVYYVQDASSMFLEEVLKQSVDLNTPLKVLDLCAAPGGKSTLLQSILHPKSLLVSNEVIKTRVNILAENITKWGADNVVVTNNDPRDFGRLPAFFDVVVVDAPCSGSGLFRKDAKAVNEWSEQNVAICSQRQQRILEDVIGSLKPGGVLIYATCSYSPAENEAIADWLLSNHSFSSIQCKLKDEWNIVATLSSEKGAHGYRFYPDKLLGEGFFIAAFKKYDGEEATALLKKSPAKNEPVTAGEIACVKPFIQQPDNYFFIKQNGAIIAVPLHLENDLRLLQSSLYLKKAGVQLGTLIRNELIPDHELVMSVIKSINIACVEGDKNTALQYLRKQDINLSANIRGWVMILYRQHALGWIKALPNRINNYYPKDWRILNK